MPARSDSPTPRQIEIHEVVLRHGGNFAKAAVELGVSANAVGFSERRFNGLRVGRPPGSAGPGAREVVAAIPDRLSRIEQRLDELTALVESFVGRQPVILNVGPNHQRQADGGVGGRKERGRIARIAG